MKNTLDDRTKGGSARPGRVTVKARLVPVKIMIGLELTVIDCGFFTTATLRVPACTASGPRVGAMTPRAS